MENSRNNQSYTWWLSKIALEKLLHGFCDCCRKSKGVKALNLFLATQVCLQAFNGQGGGGEKERRNPRVNFGQPAPYWPEPAIRREEVRHLVAENRHNHNLAPGIVRNWTKATNYHNHQNLKKTTKATILKIWSAPEASSVKPGGNQMKPAWETKLVVGHRWTLHLKWMQWNKRTHEQCTVAVLYLQVGLLQHGQRGGLLLCQQKAVHQVEQSVGCLLVDALCMLLSNDMVTILANHFQAEYLNYSFEWSICAKE